MSTPHRRKNSSAARHAATVGCSSLILILVMHCSQPIRDPEYEFADIEILPAASQEVRWTGNVLQACSYVTRPDPIEILKLAAADSATTDESRVYRLSYTEQTKLQGVPPLDFAIVKYCLEMEVGEIIEAGSAPESSSH